MILVLSHWIYTPRLKYDTPMEMAAAKFLSLLPDHSVPAAIFDPQYRGVLGKMNYGNEGEQRGKDRSNLKQMEDEEIAALVAEVGRVLIPTGHMFLWADKYHVCTGIHSWLPDNLQIVDLITWNKVRMGMGYRSRRKCEYLFVIQRQPIRAKGVWQLHNIPDVWDERVINARDSAYTHRKPVELQAKLITAVTNPGDVVIDPAAGSFSVLESCQLAKRKFSRLRY